MAIRLACFIILNDVQAMRFWSHPFVRRLTAVEELLRKQRAAMLKELCQYWIVLDGEEPSAAWTSA